MFKKSLLLALSLLLVVSVSAFAGEGSDTVGGGKLLPQLRYGYSATEWGTHSPYAASFRDWDVDAHSYYAQLNWGILNNVDLIGLVGGRSLSLGSVSSLTGATVESDWASMFMWGLGVKATFFRADNGLYVGGGALFTHSFSNDLDARVYTAAGVLSGWYDVDLSVYTLTPELHAGWHIGDTGLTPYIGVDYTWLRAMSEWVGVPAGPGEIKYRMNDPAYMFVGLDHHITDRLYLNFEGRTNFSGGWGIEGGIGYMFDICAKPAPAPVEPAPPIEPKLEPMSKN
jgi:hypothetical protein